MSLTVWLEYYKTNLFSSRNNLKKKEKKKRSNELNAIADNGIARTKV